MALAKFAFVLILAAVFYNHASAQHNPMACDKDHMKMCTEPMKKLSPTMDVKMLCPALEKGKECLHNLTEFCQDGHPVKMMAMLFMEKVKTMWQLCKGSTPYLGDNSYCTWQRVEDCMTEIKQDNVMWMDDAAQCRIWWRTKDCLHNTWKKCYDGLIKDSLNATWTMMAHSYMKCDAMTCNKHGLKYCTYMAAHSSMPKYQKCMETMKAAKCVKGTLESNCHDKVVYNYAKEEMVPKIKHMIDECKREGHIKDGDGDGDGGYDAGVNLQPTAVTLVATILMAIAARVIRL